MQRIAASRTPLVCITRRAILLILSDGHQQPDNEGRGRVALLAALLHDIGHGPFSHVFEHAAGEADLNKRHEDWGAEIIRGDTEVNQVLREADETLPEQIGALLKEEEPKDIYATIVSSQFDADRLDYIQRDRLMTGVEFGHLDRAWLLDCLEVGSVTVDSDDPVEVPCLYLNPKGMRVAEEYLEARFRLYMMVYMHKTTRAAEKMLGHLLKTAARELKGKELARRDPVLRYFTSESPPIGSYIDLDDTAVWTTLASSCLNHNAYPQISELAGRLRDRRLYKCLDVGTEDKIGGTLYGRFRRALREHDATQYEALLFDDATVALYRWYNFDEPSALNKVLVKEKVSDREPTDIAHVSKIVPALRENERIQRVYAADEKQLNELRQILEEVQ